MHVVAPTADLTHAHGSPPASAVLRHHPEDFLVEETLGFEPEGEGEHLWLWVEKRSMNTDQLARQLASIAGVRRGDVAYAGLKDRNAVTRQWFSIRLPQVELEQAAQWQDPRWKVLRAVRGRRKIRRGGSRGNRFVIILRELRGNSQRVEAHLREVARRGVPNYFGEQRFGHDNLARAEAMVGGELRVADRHLRGIYLSSLRSALFNAVLEQRVRDNIWDRALDGEALNLDGSRSYFVADNIDDGLEQRLAVGDIHPTGPLWGRGDPPSRGAALSLELAVVALCPEMWSRACIDAGMEQERRPLRLPVRQLHWQWQGDGLLQLEFSLPAGAYATSVIREIADTRTEVALE